MACLYYKRSNMKKLLILVIVSTSVFSVDAMQSSGIQVIGRMTSQRQLDIPEFAPIYNNLDNEIEVTIERIDSGTKKAVYSIFRIPKQSHHFYPVEARRPDKVSVRVLGDVSLLQKAAHFLATNTKEFNNACFKEIQIVPAGRGFEIQVVDCQLAAEHPAIN